MRLFAALSPVGSPGADYLLEATGARASPALPDDAIRTQNALCEAITRLMRGGRPEIVQLEALFALERQAQPVSELLLNQYVEGDGRTRPFEWTIWHSALRLSRSLVQAYEYFLRHIWQISDDDWTEREPMVLVQLFGHKKVEFLLRFLRYKKRSSEQWRQLNETYRLARERPLLKRGNASGDVRGKLQMVRKLEQQYLQILLLEAMNGGQFSPREALLAHRWFARWCSGLRLQLAQANNRAQLEPNGFMVDMSGSEGLKRSSASAAQFLYFDSTPLSGRIDQEIAALRDGTLSHQATTSGSRWQLELLDKLSVLFAPKPVSIERRAERIAVSLAAQVIAGYPYIVEELRKNGQNQNQNENQNQNQNHTTSSAAGLESEDTASPSAGADFSPLFAASGGAGPVPGSITGLFDAIPQVWQVKDRSDSGCRMRAQIDNLDLVIPGSLIAVRDDEASPWIVSVVRWFRRLMVDHVEIGVEYLGREPRFVKMVPDCDGDLATADAPDRASMCFAALYLPPSEKHPAMPIKTMLLPAREFRAGCDVTLLSSDATYRIRLNGPIQQQFEYVWTSFAVVEKVAAHPTGD